MAAIVMDHVECTDTNGFIMQNGGVVPPSLLQENRVPRFYKEAIAKCGAPSQSQLPNTALVYNLMVTSCLPRAILGNIWSLVNRTMPGQLTRQEFFSCLALIALIQKGQPLSALSTMSTLPIPHLQACAPFAQHLPGRSIFQQQGFCQTVQKTDSSGVTVNLQTMATTSSAMSLLADIDFSKPVNNSTTFTQSTVVSVAQNPVLQSKPSISTVSTSKNSTALGIQAPIALASNQSFDVTTNLNNQVFSKDMHQLSSSTLQNSALPDKILDFVPSILRSNSHTSLSETIPCSGSSATNVDTDKTVGILESVKITLTAMAFSKEKFLISDPDVYATMKLITGASKDGEEECLYVWRRCIEEACKLFSDADSLLPCSAAAYIAEIVHTDRGARYLNALYEIHEMTLRIRKGRIDKLIKQKELLGKIDKIWARFECFMEKTIGSEDTNHSGETVNKIVPPVCGICLLRISTNSMLEFTGTVYHKQCANLWINRVDSFLPKLKKY
uniref:EH domain-containing protein n=1 Tax=Elaeophora elaphi TaxID=1147741 RepID=A0A0R3RWB1_9BILA